MEMEVEGEGGGDSCGSTMRSCAEVGSTRIRRPPLSISRALQRAGVPAVVRSLAVVPAQAASSRRPEQDPTRSAALRGGPGHSVSVRLLARSPSPRLCPIATRPGSLPPPTRGASGAGETNAERTMSSRSGPCRGAHTHTHRGPITGGGALLLTCGRVEHVSVVVRRWRRRGLRPGRGRSRATTGWREAQPFSETNAGQGRGRAVAGAF